MTDAIAPVLIVLTLAAIVSAYFLPTIVAECRHHHNLTAVFVANLLFGWTVIGWCLTLVWSFVRR